MFSLIYSGLEDAAMLADMLIFNYFRYPFRGIKFDCVHNSRRYRFHEVPLFDCSDVKICKTLNEYCDHLTKYVDWIALVFDCCAKKESTICSCCVSGKLSGYGTLARAEDSHHVRLYQLERQLIQRLSKRGSRLMTLLNFLLNHTDTDILLFYTLFEIEFFELPSSGKLSKAFSNIHVTLQAITDYAIALLNEPENFTDTIVTTMLKNKIPLNIELLPQIVQQEVEYFQFKHTLLLCKQFGCEHTYGVLLPSLPSLEENEDAVWFGNGKEKNTNK